LDLNYYNRYPGDYSRDTAHLSLIEHGAYALLLDTYYATEKPLPMEKKQLYRICRASTATERKAVDVVVAQFFISDGDVLRNARADQEIGSALARQAAARENGNRGGRPRKTQPITEQEPSGFHIDNPGGTQEEPSGKAVQDQDQERLKEKRTTLSGDAGRCISWEFLAGIIDGEAQVRLNRYEQNGSFTIIPRITIYNTNFQLLESIRSGLGIGSISSRERLNLNAKDLHEINFTRDEISKIVEHCSEHVVAKKEQFAMLADFLLHWPEDKTYCEALHKRTKHLNARGKPDADHLINGKTPSFRSEAIEVLQFLNEKTGRKFREGDTNLKLIVARLKSGASVQDCKTVIARKHRQWAKDDKMWPYLRPATLFNATKFENYLGECVPPEEEKRRVE